MPGGVVFVPDLEALEIKPNAYYLGSNWHLVRLHTLRPDCTTEEFRQAPERLKEIFEKDLPHDLELLSNRVYERLKKKRQVPQKHYHIEKRIASAA